jgi:hypothetical protein
MKSRLLLLFSLFSLPFLGVAQRIGAHESVGRISIPKTSFSSVSEGRSIGQQIIDVVGLKPNFEIREANVPNAAAVVYGGKRYVLYNPNFINKLNAATGTKWAGISVLAHEIGHHLNGHTLTGKGSVPASELEADEFSGFVLKKMGATLDQAQIAMKVAAGERASKTHPGQYDRLLAIQKGWERAGGVVSNNTASTRRADPSTASAPISSSQIIGRIRFNADPNSAYYVTTRYNVVKVQNNQLSVIGKLASSNSSQYPYLIYDENVKLYVDRRGNILNQNGKSVGVLRNT